MHATLRETQWNQNAEYHGNMGDKQAQHAVTDVQGVVYAYQYNVCRKLLHISSSGTIMQQTIYMVKENCKPQKYSEQF